MDQLTALRALGAGLPGPSDAALASGRALLAARAAAGAAPGSPALQAADVPPGDTDATAAGPISTRAPRRRARGGSRRAPSRRPAGQPFLALGGVAAAVLVVAIVLVNALGIGAWQQNGISAPTTETAAPTPSTVFTLPGDCASLVDPSILIEWSARYGAAPLVGEMGAPLDNSSPTRPAGRACSYGNTDSDLPSLTIGVDVITADNPRALKEADFESQGLEFSTQPDGDSLYTSGTPDASGVVAQVYLVSDDASIGLSIRGVPAADGPLLVSLMTSWLPRVSARLEEPATSTPAPTSAPSGFRLPATCADALGSSILPAWASAFGGPDGTAVLDASGYRVPDTDETGLHCSYGTNDGGPMLTIIVGTVDTAPGGRARAEAQQESYGATRETVGEGTLFTLQPGLTPSPAGLTYIDDTAVISVNAQGTDTAAGSLLPFLRSALDDIAARTGATP